MEGLNAHERELARVDTQMKQLKHPSVVIVDIDGVIIDWTTSFENWLEQERGHVRIPGAEQHYSMHNRWRGMEAHQMLALIDEFNRSEVFSTLPALQDAADGVKHIRSVYPGRKMIAVTACGNSPDTCVYRMKNLDTILGPGFFSFIIFLPLGASKKHVFEQYENSVVIEDSLSHAIHAAEAGHSVILIDQPYNQSNNTTFGVFRSTWVDVIANIKKETIAA